MGLLVFNGCYGASTLVEEVISTAWLFGIWPLSALATALVPPVLLGLGRGWKKALVAFFIGLLVSVFIWIAWVPIGFAVFC